ncbi:hypothetical protein MaudCBS49596_007543 [Microsporum audouinii]
MNFLRSRRESKDLKTASIEVVCFFEEFKTAMGEIVSKASASITGHETQLIPADHRDMRIFASKDEDDYQRISRVLKRWAVMLQSPQPPGQRLVSVWPSFYSRYNHTQGQLWLTALTYYMVGRHGHDECGQKHGPDDRKSPRR